MDAEFFQGKGGRAGGAGRQAAKQPTWTAVAGVAATAVLLFLLWWFFSLPPPTHPTPALPPRPVITAPPPSLEHFVHDLVNEYRQGKGLNPLEYSREIAAIAHVHSRLMAEHTRPMGHGGFSDRARRVSNFMSYRNIGENVAKINHGAEGGEAKGAVSGWLQSPGHRATIEGDFTLTGIGISQSWDGTYYFTQLFMTPGGTPPRG